MPRIAKDPNSKPEALRLAEKHAQEALRRYCRREIGVQAQLARETGINAPVLSRMAQGLNPISLEQAIQIAVATKNALPAPVLCPSRADLLAQYVELHNASEPIAETA